MLKHPTIDIPDLGHVDHAWDLLGEWRIMAALPELLTPLGGTLTFLSWDVAEVEFSAHASLPSDWAATLRLTRLAPFAWIDAGGGAIGSAFESATLGRLTAAFWPGELQLSSEPASDAPHAMTATARRPPTYYRAKYPAAAG